MMIGGVSLHEWRACTRKHKLTKQGAKKKAKLNRQRGIELAAYKCQFCEGWHVAKKTK